MNNTSHTSNIKDSALKESQNTDIIQECVTDDCKDCSGSYISKSFGHKLICICACHKLNYDKTGYRVKTDLKSNSLQRGWHLIKNDKLSTHIDDVKHYIKSEHAPWARGYLVDILKQYLAANTVVIVNDKGESVNSRKYYDRAFELRLLGVRPTPIYQIYRADLAAGLLDELDALGPYSRSYVLHQAVARILEDINFELFHNSTSRVLRVELV